MTSEQWAAIVGIFERALDLPEVERDAFVARECADETMRREVVSLLDNAGDDDPAADVVARAAREAFGGRVEDLAGTRLGSFRIETQLGRGGMGVIYRAVDERLDRTVALKVLASAGDEQLVNEAKIAATLNHPNVATVYEAGRGDGRAFIAMELVDGKTLRELLATRLAPREVLSIARQILAGLSAAHAADLAHRDLKPENVMITSAGVVKLLDFGIAQRHAEHDAAIRGTPAYMSPEQMRGAPVDQRSDIYSFGVVLYELVAGHRPADPPKPPASPFASVIMPLSALHIDEAIGRTLLLGGRAKEALPILERAAATCYPVRFPIHATRAIYYLGEARAALGDTAGACAAYRAVLDRWGNAKPRSITADRARARATALGCP